MPIEAKSLLTSVPWTPRMDQHAFKSDPEPTYETTSLAAYSSDFSTPNITFWSSQATPSGIGRPHHQAHKRYTSSPLMSGTREETPALTSPLRTMSCMTSECGLGISFPGSHCNASIDEKVTTIASDTSSSDPLPSTPIKEEEDMSDDAMDSPIPASDEMVVKEELPMTVAEMRAEKRKMKRFRLNHQQTRYLMSEYARQAHPDASQREKLSRDIPGLSPRQVQVWFQNRYFTSLLNSYARFRADTKKASQAQESNTSRSR